MRLTEWNNCSEDLWLAGVTSKASSSTTSLMMHEPRNLGIRSITFLKALLSLLRLLGWDSKHTSETARAMVFPKSSYLIISSEVLTGHTKSRESSKPRHLKKLHGSLKMWRLALVPRRLISSRGRWPIIRMEIGYLMWKKRSIQFMLFYVEMRKFGLPMRVRPFYVEERRRACRPHRWNWVSQTKTCRSAAKFTRTYK